MARRLSLRELEEEARAQGYLLVKAKANWHPILLDHIRQRRLVYAIKLWREVTGLNLATAREQIEAICCLNIEPPNGTEYPDLPNLRSDLVTPGDQRVGQFDYYGNPWDEKLTEQDKADAAAVHAAEVRAARRRRGKYPPPTGEYSREK